MKGRTISSKTITWQSLAARRRLPLPFRVRGFTLVEMLAVMGIIALLLVLIGPSIVSIMRGQGVTRAIDEISTACESARGQAMSRNTWVFLCISNPKAGSSPANQLVLAEMASKDGTVSTVSGSSTQLDPAGLIALLALARIQNASATLVSPSDPTHQTAVASTLQCSLSTGGTTVSYDTVVAFSPQGEAILDPSNRALNTWVQLHVAEFRGTASTVNTAEVKVSGPSGQCVVLRQ